MRLRFLPEADAEVLQIRERYLLEATPRVVLRFADDLESTLGSIVDWPRSAAPDEAGFRRRLLQLFPYSVVYQI